MPEPKRRVYEATDADLEQAGAKGAQAILNRVEDKLKVLDQIELLGRLQAGLIRLEDICTLYGVSKRTVHDWPLKPADTPTQQNLYRVEDIADQLVDSQRLRLGAPDWRSGRVSLPDRADWPKEDPT